MRLVSVLYQDFHPFEGIIDGITDGICSSNPNDLQEGDIIICHGGEDISPALYKQGRSSRGYGDYQPSRRDRIEWTMMTKAKELNIPIIGICRGAQMLCALEGGYLIQDVSNHSGMHEVHTFDNKTIMVNSIHHQMMAPVGDYKLIAWSKPRSHKYNFMYYDTEVNEKIHPITHDKDPEFIHFPSGFAIQWHPEMMRATTEANQYIGKYINEHLKEYV